MQCLFGFVEEALYLTLDARAGHRLPSFLDASVTRQYWDDDSGLSTI